MSKSQTVSVVEQYESGACLAHQRPLVLFNHDLLHAVLVEAVHRLDRQRKKQPMIDRFARMMFTVLDLVPKLVSLFYVSAEELERKRLNEESRRVEREMSPSALLDWLDHQEVDCIKITAEKWNLHWLYNRVIPGPPALHISGEDDTLETLSFIEAYCKECDRMYSPSDLERLYWGYNHGPLAAGGGRRLVCPEKHPVMEVQDWIS